MSRLRLNQELRNKIASRWRVHAEAEHTNEKEKFFQERESFLDKQNDTWDLAKQCVTRQYPKEDVKMAHYLQDKYPNVNTIAKDSCFHFGYMNEKGSSENIEEGDEEKYITKHFDFRLNGSIDGVDRQNEIDGYNPESRDFAYVIWQQAKGQMVMAHYKWIKSVLTQMKFVKDVIKGYKYLDEALEFAKESGLNINDAEIIRTNSTGLIMYNPKNAAEMLKSMKNKSQSREQKIALRKAYNQEQSTQ
jgi:hypothetical protein